MQREQLSVFDQAGPTHGATHRGMSDPGCAGSQAHATCAVPGEKEVLSMAGGDNSRGGLPKGMFQRCLPATAAPAGWTTALAAVQPS